MIIRTKYLGATDRKAGRIKATAGSGRSITVPFEHEHNGLRNHRNAAMLLAEKLNLKGEWRRIWDDSNLNGWAFVQVSSSVEAFTVN